MKLNIKIDYKTSVQYNVYNPINKNKLDLSVCNNTIIIICSSIELNNNTMDLNNQL